VIVQDFAHELFLNPPEAPPEHSRSVLGLARLTAAPQSGFGQWRGNQTSKGGGGHGDSPLGSHRRIDLEQDEALVSSMVPSTGLPSSMEVLNTMSFAPLAFALLAA
jgi:hypothetical protein